MSMDDDSVVVAHDTDMAEAAIDDQDLALGKFVCAVAFSLVSRLNEFDACVRIGVELHQSVILINFVSSKCSCSNVCARQYI